MSDKPHPRYAAEDLRVFARTLLERAGVQVDIAADVATVLLDGDLLGHTTHGLALLAPYLDELAHDRMARTGEPTVLVRRLAAQTWDGNRLPGPWLALRALEAATIMARECGTGTVVIRRSHHIACLAAYLKRATDNGMVAIIESSDPTVNAVVPHGGLTPFITPNPIAAGLPTSGDPILVDVSTSITSMGYAQQQMRAGKRLPGPWLIDAEGNPTSDPGALFTDPKGARAAYPAAAIRCMSAPPHIACSAQCSVKSYTADRPPIWSCAHHRSASGLPSKYSETQKREAIARDVIHSLTKPTQVPLTSSTRYPCRSNECVSQSP